MGMTRRDLASIKDAVVCVGDSRGLVVEVRRRRLVVTAVHCLPFLLNRTAFVGGRST